VNLYAKLCERDAAGRPVAVGVIGAGKFGAMFLAQAPLTRGLYVVGVADLDPARARAQLAAAGWDAPRYAAASLGEALRTGGTHVGPDAEALIALAELEVIVEATGVPAAGIRHALAAIRHGKHVVMVNVEPDALVGPLLARKAQQAGVVYSLAWGDQPALICEQVDWARACGFHVVAAGKGTRYEPHYHRSTPDTVWDILDKYLQIKDPRLDQPEDVQQLHRRDEVRDRDDGGLQRDRPHAAERRPDLPAGKPVRPRRNLQAARRGRRAGGGGRHRGRFVG
jgi:predicted homoserine dehydrogenase-like protein